MSDHRLISWYELRLRVPADASVHLMEQPHQAVSSLRVHGCEASASSGSTFWVSAARQTLEADATLESWSASIIDAAGDRRVRVHRRVGSHDVVFAEPRSEDPIGTFIFAVVNGHGFNIMTGAAPDARSQAEIASILATLHFESDSA